jgi:hypothetical protein
MEAFPEVPMLRSTRWLPLVAVLVLFAAPARAQDGTPPPAEPPPDSTVVPELPVTTPPATSRTIPPPPVAEFDTSLALPLVVELRTRAEINDDLIRMADLKAAALRRVTLQRSYEARRKAQVDIKKNEVASVKIRLDLAKKEKRTADQKELEKTKRRLEGEQRYLERGRDLHAAEASFQQALASYAQARVDEGKLESKMHDLGDLASPVVRASAGTRSAQYKLIAAMKTRADRGSDLASSERTAADRRKGVLDAYAEMIKL